MEEWQSGLERCGDSDTVWLVRGPREEEKVGVQGHQEVGRKAKWQRKEYTWPVCLRLGLPGALQQ